MKRTLALIALPILAITLAACGSSSDAEVEETVTTEQTQSEENVVTVEESEVVEEETDAAEEEVITAGNPTFGDTYTWENGLAITISEPEEATLSDLAGEMYNLEAGTPIAFTITLTNGTDKDIESIMINTQMTSGSKESQMIFDSATGFDLPSAVVIPGKSLEWKVGFIAADPADMVLTVSDALDFSSEQVHFVN